MHGTRIIMKDKFGQLEIGIGTGTGMIHSLNDLRV